MRRLARSLALAALLAPAAALAQGVDPTGTPDADPIFERAQELVLRGNGTDGRAIVDSVLAATRPGSQEYAEALYWRAALAETASEAERSYLRLTIEHPLHPRTEQALVRLAQLEQTRGNRMLAVSRLQRAVLDFPGSPQRARTQFRMARLYLEEQRMPEGCGALQEALRMAEPTDVELRNELEYVARGCAGVPPVTPPPTRIATPSAVERPSAPAPAPVTPPVAEPPRAATPRPAAPRPSTPAPAPAPAPRPSTPAPTPAPAPSSAAAGAFSVQVAAFDRAAPAEALVKTLRADGIDARIDADGEWHRVRIGRFATRAAAAEQATTLKARGITGFVTGTGR